MDLMMICQKMTYWKMREWPFELRFLTRYDLLR